MHVLHQLHNSRNAFLVEQMLLAMEYSTHYRGQVKSDMQLSLNTIGFCRASYLFYYMLVLFSFIYLLFLISKVLYYNSLLLELSEILDMIHSDMQDCISVQWRF